MRASEASASRRAALGPLDALLALGDAAAQAGVLLLQRVHLLAPRLDQALRLFDLGQDAAATLLRLRERRLQVGALVAQRLQLRLDFGAAAGPWLSTRSASKVRRCSSACTWSASARWRDATLAIAPSPAPPRRR